MKAGTLVPETASEALVGRTAEVRVPWGSLQVTVSEPIEETADGKQAGHGASLVGVQVALDGPEDLLVADRLPDGALQDPTFTLVADEQEYLLEGLTGWVDDNEIAQVARRQYVALKGEPDGRSACASATTASTRSSTASPATSTGTRPSRSTSWASPAAPSRAATRCGAPAPPTSARTSRRCLVTSSAQRPYVAGLGWAPEGKNWMVVTVLTGAPTEFAGPDGTYEVDESTSTYLLDVQGPEESFALNDALPAGAAEDDERPAGRHLRGRPGAADRPVRGPHAADRRDRGDHGQEGQPRDEDQDVQGTRRAGRLRLIHSGTRSGEC